MCSAFIQNAFHTPTLQVRQRNRRDPNDPDRIVALPQDRVVRPISRLRQDCPPG
jgi:hypothetical protein